MKSKIFKFSKSLVKILLPAVSKILIKLKLNRRVINFLHETSYNSNFKYNFTSLLEKFLEKNKIVALDVGAQGGFNSDTFFPKKYDSYLRYGLQLPTSTTLVIESPRFSLELLLLSPEPIEALLDGQAPARDRKRNYRAATELPDRR